MNVPPVITPKGFLVPLAGPAMQAIALVPKAGGIVLGRHEQCDVCLPADAERVSRFHARFDHDGARWHITDLGSRCGTFVNGMKLTPQADQLLSEGDLIRITPWTFALSSTAKKRGLQPADDSGPTIVRTLSQDSSQHLADAMLALLLESAGALHAETDETRLAEQIIDAALRGTGLQNAAMLRPVDAAGRIEIIASRFPSQSEQSPIHFSRSLINAASEGNVAQMLAGGSGDVSQSMVQLQINSALCVPLMLGGTVAAYLYLDSRGTRMHTVPPGASAFCVALGRIASLALANLKRLEMEKRDAVMRAELAAAAAAQKWIMPAREGCFGAFKTIGESRAGQYVGGDFFDIIPLDEHRIAVAVGDVSGKGVAASVLMTATQGFLHAALRESGDPAAAVTAANRFVTPRRAEGKFVTMWVGVFDARDGTLRYVDAGHGYAVLHRADGSFEMLDAGSCLPIGVEEGSPYACESIPFSRGDRVMVVSDGIVEQFGIVQTELAASRQQFQVESLRHSMTRPSDDPVKTLFEAVIRHAGTEKLSDDATAVLVKWAAERP
jgi:serine phosphatase RsbU (regulator of sigma subunit)